MFKFYTINQFQNTMFVLFLLGLDWLEGRRNRLWRDLKLGTCKFLLTAIFKSVIYFDVKHFWNYVYLTELTFEDRPGANFFIELIQQT